MKLPRKKKEKPELQYFQNLKSGWSIIKVHLKEQYSELTDEDLSYEEGKEKQLLERLGIKLGKTREEMERIIQDIALSPPKAGSPKVK